MGWAVVVTMALNEKIAASEIARLDLLAYVPMFREAVGGGIRTGVLFSRYVFVCGIERRCYDVRKARGVIDVISMNGEICKLPDYEIESLRMREDRDGFIWLKHPEPAKKVWHFRKGQRVKIISGPLAGLSGLHSGMSDRDRQSVILSMLGQKRAVNISTACLEVA